MYYETRIGDDAYMMIEAAAVGSMQKSEAAELANPIGAFPKALELAGSIARFMDDHVGETARELKMEASFTFSILCDGNGMVMMSKTPEGGQFRCTLRIPPPS